MGRPRIHANPGDAVRAWRLRNPERNREQTRASVQRWRAQNPERYAAARAAERTAYGLSVEELDAMLARQGGRCAICRDEPGDRRLGVDHDHATGRVRGLLCPRCNMALGLFRDNADALRAAAGYLERQA